MNPRKFSSLLTYGFLAQLVAAPSEYLGGMGSNPIQLVKLKIKLNLI